MSWLLGRPHRGESLRSLLAPYLDAVAALKSSRAGSTTYPGSPALVQSLPAPAGSLVACELEPNAAAALKRNFASDRRVKVLAIDGWTALNAYVPPKERRGLVLIDPPFEEGGDFARLAQDFERAHHKWASGIYLLWYPIKAREEPDALARRLQADPARAKDTARRDQASPPPRPADPRLTGCGLIVVNPPWTLEQELHAILLPGAASDARRRPSDHSASSGSAPNG